jgi:tetratricopeptide (TPR) repeat protein
MTFICGPDIRLPEALLIPRKPAFNSPNKRLRKIRNYPLPYWLAAIAEYTLGQLGAEPQKIAVEHAMRNVEEAIRLDPGFGDAHASHALVLYAGNHDWPKAEAEFKQAVGLGSISALSLYGWALSTRGRFSEADQQLLAAIERDPLSAGPRFNRHIALFFEGKRPN